MSGDPQAHVNRLSLNTESNSTGFSFQPNDGKSTTSVNASEIRTVLLRHSHLLYHTYTVLLFYFYAVHNFLLFYHFILDCVRYACQVLIIKRICMHVSYFATEHAEAVW